MTAATKNTYKLTLLEGGARRPGLGDMGGGELEDDPADPPPKDGTEPYADMLNQPAHVGSSHAAVVQPLVLTIFFDGINPKIETIQCVNDDLDDGDFVITRIGTGRYQITWEKWKLPARRCQPRTSANDLTIDKATVVAAYFDTDDPLVEGIEVRCRDDGAYFDFTHTLVVS